MKRFWRYNGLLAVLLGFFLVSFLLPGASGVRLRNEEALARGIPSQSLMEYMGSSRFWFESFQNWQSEFLAIGSMVVLSIYLREKGSPESKPINLPHDEHE